MKYLVELVFGIGFFGLSAIALTFFLRFLLLTWAVRTIGRVVHSVLEFVKRLCRALIFIFAPALLGGFIVGTGVGVGENAMGNDGNGPSDPTQTILLAFLSFFVIVAIRAWQWNTRRALPGSQNFATLANEQPPNLSSQPPYPGGYEKVADAWGKAVELAPGRRDDLMHAQGACAELVIAVAHHEDIADTAMIETAALIRNHLATLIDSTERRLCCASPGEKAVIIEEMVNFLLGFGRRARNDLATACRGMERGDAALRSHLASQLFGGH